MNPLLIQRKERRTMVQRTTIIAIKKFKGSCYNCGKSRHRSSECRAPKNKNKNKGQANIVESNYMDIEDLCVFLSEYNLVENPKEWWIDSAATRQSSKLIYELIN